MRVETTEGNLFYTHKSKKESVWTVPDEIKDAVAKLEHDEAEAKVAAAAKEKEDAIREQEELVRIKLEVQEAAKRKAEDAPLDEVTISKKARVEDEDEDEDSEDSEPEEDWQREAAAQLAAEAEEERLRLEEEAKRAQEEAEEEARKAKEAPKLNMPERVDLSSEEAKALFKVRLSTFMIAFELTFIYIDTSTRKRYQSTPSLGPCPSVICIRPAICSYLVRRRTARSI